MAKDFQFPSWLQRTDEQLAQEAATQDLRRASHTRAHKTLAEELVGRGALLEETARGNLAAAQTDIDSGISGQMMDEQMARERRKLAEALAMQGRYNEAVEVSPDDDTTAHYQEIATAIVLPDDARCECPDVEGTQDGVELSITPRFVSQRIFSTQHNSVVDLVKCSTCGHSNARPLTGRLLQSQGAQAQNRMAATTEGQRFVRDVDLLRRVP